MIRKSVYRFEKGGEGTLELPNGTYEFSYKTDGDKCRRIFDELQKGLDPEQRELLFSFEEAMNQSGSYAMEFFFWKGYERGLADEKERRD